MTVIGWAQIILFCAIVAALPPLFGGYMTLIHSSSSMGPAATQVVAPPELRGRISAIFVLVTGLIGMALGTFLVGFFTDKVFGDPMRIGTSLILLVVIVLSAAGILFAQGRAGMRSLVQGKEVIA